MQTFPRSIENNIHSILKVLCEHSAILLKISRKVKTKSIVALFSIGASSTILKWKVLTKFMLKDWVLEKKIFKIAYL